MIQAYVFSIGEPTTDLCLEALNRNGIDAVLYQSPSSFAEKYKTLMTTAKPPFLRVDADIIVNHRVQEYLEKALDWSCPYGWVWWQQDLQPISVMYYSEKVVELIKPHLNDEVFNTAVRPEQYMWSLPEMQGKNHKINIPVGLKGYGVRELEPVVSRKNARGQSYDWGWIVELNNL